MSERTPRAEGSLPERLRSGGGSEFERRLLDAAARERPARELYERMALGIGISPVVVPPTGEVALKTTTPKAAVASRAPLYWISATAVVIATGGLIAIRASSSRINTPAVPRPSNSAAPLASPAVAATLAPARTAVAAAVPLKPTAASTPRSRLNATTTDLQDQIALVDGAHAALSAGASNRALELLRQYHSKYPAGSFQPEAAALKIEALAKLGRSAEARALGRRFIDEHRGSPLADRVSRILDNAP